jgi:cell fate regulator YaaT (PSP1 superfamily)
LGKYLATYGKPRFLGIVEFDPDTAGVLSSDGLIIATSHRGEEVASVMGPLNETQESEYRGMKTVSEHGEGPPRGGDPMVGDIEFVRVLTSEDREQWESRKGTEGDILSEAQEMAEGHHLELKLVDAETMIDGKKLFLYFTSETRIDFRNLVKDLARKFRTRIELRQMGVRDEARLISGVASCGLPCCCSYWLNQFAPIGIRMVKEQNIALNPAKISGICGRLMCCMSFEHKVYKDLWAGLPGPGSKIKTPNGSYVVVAMDISRESVRCHKPTGGDVSVPIAMFQDFRAAIMGGGEWEPPRDENEAERERPRGKYGCACRRNIEFGGSARIAPGNAIQPLFHAEIRATGGETPKQDAEKTEAASPPDQYAGRRHNRKGGRYRRPDTETVRAETIRPRDKISRQKLPEPIPETAEAVPPQVKAARNRRKKRRQKHGPSAPLAEN